MELSARQVAALMVGYSSLVLALMAYPIPRLARPFDYDTDAVQAFLISKAPESFAKCIRTRLRNGCSDLRFTIDLSADFRAAFSAVPCEVQPTDLHGESTVSTTNEHPLSNP